MRLFHAMVTSTLLAASANYVGAQTPAGFTRQMSQATNPPNNSMGSFAIEAGAASLGSLAGIGLVFAVKDCGNDDLGCGIIRVTAAGALGVIGATVGTTIASRYNGSSRSTTGAVLGGLAGTGIGLALHYLLQDYAGYGVSDPGVVPIFVISQGILTAAGSRLLGRARTR